MSGLFAKANVVLKWIIMPSQTSSVLLSISLHPVRLRSVQAGWRMNIHDQFNVLLGFDKIKFLPREFSSFGRTDMIWFGSQDLNTRVDYFSSKYFSRESETSLWHRMVFLPIVTLWKGSELRKKRSLSPSTNSCSLSLLWYIFLPLTVPPSCPYTAYCTPSEITLQMNLHLHLQNYMAGIESLLSAVYDEGLCYWSESNTQRYRIQQYEAEAKAIERKVRALICIESDKGARFERVFSGVHGVQL